MARMRTKKSAYRVLVGKYEEQWPLETQRRKMEDKKIEGISKSEMGIWTGLIWLRIDQAAGFYQCGNKPSGPTKFGGFFD